jgi:hypothetical protein
MHFSGPVGQFVRLKRIRTTTLINLRALDARREIFSLFEGRLSVHRNMENLGPIIEITKC